MTARAIGDVLAGRQTPMGRRTFQPVRRDSRHAGEREHRMWRPLGRTKQEVDRFRWAMLKAAKFFELKGRQAGKKNGPIGSIAIETLECLLWMADRKTGALDPAIAYICARIRRSRAAVVAALSRLKEHGFLDWVRRTEPTNNVGAGPQVRQISNAYGFDLDKLATKTTSAAAWIRRALSSGPPPDCETARRAHDCVEVDAMLATASPGEQARFHAGDGELGDALASLARVIGSSASSDGGQNQGDEY